MIDTASEMAAVAAEISAQPGESLSSEPVSSATDTTATASPATQDAGAQSTASTAGESQPAEGTKPRGPLPYERHEAILTKTREEYEAKLRELEWAKDTKREEVERYRNIYEWADKDPIGFYEFMGRQLKSDERFRSHFQSQEPAKQEPVDPKPEPDILLEDGRMTFSQEKMLELLEWNNRQSEKRLAERYGPIEQQYKAQTVIHRATEEARSILADARTWPGFTKHEAEIQKLMATDGRVTLESAYRRVVIPALEAEKEAARQQVRQEVLTELKGKPNASTLNPGAGSVQPPKSFKGMSTEEIMREVHNELAQG